ncbi:MAG: hypothetical protein ACREEM_00855 [Blastocatellia bacterium]
MKKNLMLIALVIGLATLGAACSANKEAASESTGAPAAPATASPAATAAASKSDDIPAAVHAALPNAQITKQHKDLTDAQAASVEKQSGLKLNDKDHHSYLAFASEGGMRKQVGAASLVNANGHEVVIVYASEKGSPVIKEVHGESGGVPHNFLDQFKGKGHDNKLRLGQDIKAQWVDEATARALTDAIRLDVVTMQTLFGASHSH